MVGVERSKACGTCQARKVKCDRIRPACSQCIKYQWTCPGYQIGKKKPLKSRKQVPVRRLYNAQPIASKPSSPNHSQDLEIPRTQTLSTIIDPSSEMVFINLMAPPNFPAPALALKLIDHLTSPKPTGFSIKQMGSFLDLVPAYIGTSRALDDALQCLCTAYVSFIRQTEISNRKEYLKALKSLRQALSNSEDALSSQTLCAAICLSWYEVLTNKFNDLWLAHATGCSRIIQLRGPSKHTEGFGRALLHAEHGLMSCEALVRGTQCFLDTPSWRPIVYSPLPTKDRQAESRFVLNHFAHMATLSRLRKRVWAADAITFDDPTLLQDLLDHRELFKRDLRTTSLAEPLTPSLLSSRDDEEQSKLDAYSLLFCKNALGHIMVNTALLDLYHIQPELPSLSAEYLHVEINGLFELAHGCYLKAKKVAPVTCRRLVSIYRVICGVMKRECGYHSVWDQVETMICAEG